MDQISVQMARHDRRWGGGAQQDSHEFLLSLLERLQAECDRNDSKPEYRELPGTGSVAQQAAAATWYAREWSDSWIDDVFGGLLQSTIKCQRCGHESHCFDACTNLSLPLPSAGASCSDSAGVPLEACLQKFAEREDLDAAYRCAGCGKETPMAKWFHIYRPPRTLILHLKRFNQRSGRGGVASAVLGRGQSFSRMQKNDTPVVIPYVLDLAPFCSADGLREARASGRFKLLAVSQHSGDMRGGHYTATARAASNREWYHFNDSNVAPAQCPAGPSSSAYVLFYHMA
jgi:ubiquitin C-terminal hydrolase